MKIVLNYDSANGFCEGMASVCRDGKWGFIDTSGKEVVPCKYDCVNAFHEGMARVNIGGRWERSEVDGTPYIFGGKTGFINKTGSEVIPCQYEFTDNFHDGLALIEVREDGKSNYFYIDKSGRRAGPSIKHWDGIFSEGLAKTYSDGKCGFMDKTGTVVVPCIYDDAGDFHEGLARVARNNKAPAGYPAWGFIDASGKEVVPCKYDHVDDFHEGMAQVWVGGEWRCSEDDYPGIHLPILSGCKIGYIDKSGREVIPCQYDYAEDFHDGLANVNGGFIDKAGQVVIQPANGAASFSEGLAWFHSGNKSGYIDKTGQVAIPARFDRAYDFHDDLAMVKENRTWGFIDKTGQMVIEYKTEPAPEPPKFPVSDDLPF